MTPTIKESPVKTKFVCGIFVLFAVRYLLKIVLHQDIMFVNAALYGSIILCLTAYKFPVRYVGFLIFMAMALCVNVSAMRCALIVMLCFISSSVNIKKLAMTNLVTGIVIICAVLYLLHAGILEDKVHEAFNGLNGATRVRHSLGLGDNRFTLLVFSVVLNLFIILYARIKEWLLCAIILGIVFYTYVATGSNTGFIGGLSLCLFCMLNKFKWTRRLMLSKKILYYMPLYCIAMTVFAAVMSNYTPVLDQIFTMRPHFTWVYLTSINPVTVLLGDAQNMSSEDFYVDSSHIHLLLECGVVFFAFYYLIYLRAVKYYRSLPEKVASQHSYFIPVIFASMVTGLTECTLLEISMIGNGIFWSVLFKFAYEYDMQQSRQSLPTVSRVATNQVA